MRTPHLPLAIALAATLLASAAHAQSSYVMTTLSSPASSQGFVATAIDNAGKVVGFQQMRDGTLYAAPGDFGALLQCFFGCAAYTTQMVTWPAGTGSRVSASRGQTYFLPVDANGQGNAVGVSVRLAAGKVNVLPFVTPGRASQYTSLFGNRTTSTVSLINGTKDTLFDFQLYGLTENNGIYGGGKAATAGADPYPDVVLPTVRLNGVNTRTPVPEPYVTGRYTAMNNVGDAAGQVSITTRGAFVPALWQAGNLSLIDLPATYQPVVINNAGQVLLQNPSVDGQASVWFNGAATAINGNGKRVFATDMNSSGTVVGCTQNAVAAPKRADNTAFIWTNGVLQDLSQVLTSKGVKLPSGTRLGCPMAINDSGSILAYYYRTASVNTVTWVRFTARP